MEQNGQEYNLLEKKINKKAPKRAVNWILIMNSKILLLLCVLTTKLRIKCKEKRKDLKIPARKCGRKWSGIQSFRKIQK